MVKKIKKSDKKDEKQDQKGPKQTKLDQFLKPKTDDDDTNKDLNGQNPENINTNKEKKEKKRAPRRRKRKNKDGEKPKKKGQFAPAKYPYKSVVAQLAKLGKGKQAKCKQCKQPIEMGALRIGIQSTHWNMVQWKHLDCFCITKKFFNYDTSKVYDLELLEEEDQDRVKDHFSGKSEGAKLQLERRRKSSSKRTKLRERYERNIEMRKQGDWPASQDDPQEETLDALVGRRITRQVKEKLIKMSSDNQDQLKEFLNDEDTHYVERQKKRPNYNEDSYYYDCDFLSDMEDEDTAGSEDKDCQVKNAEEEVFMSENSEMEDEGEENLF